MRGELKKKTKSNLTISIDNTMFDEIKKESQERGLSTNAYLNEVLQRHILFYRHVIKQGGLVIPRGFFTSLLEFVEEDRLSKIFEREGGFDVIISILVQNNIPITLDNLIKYVFEGIALWAGAYNKFSFRKNKLNMELFFEHRLGVKWSNTFGSEASRLVTKYTGLDTDYKSSSNIVKVIVAIQPSQH